MKPNLPILVHLVSFHGIPTQKSKIIVKHLIHEECTRLENVELLFRSIFACHLSFHISTALNCGHTPIQ